MAVWSSVKLRGLITAGRWDAEFYRPEHLKRAKLLLRLGAVPLGRDCTIANGKTPARYVEMGETAVVRSGDLVTTLVYRAPHRGYLEANQVDRSSLLRKGDVLISSIGVGSIGKVGLVIDPSGLATVAEVTVVRSGVYSPEFLYAYLSTSTGLGEIERRVTGATGQQHLIKSQAESILIPPPPKEGLDRELRETVGRAVATEKKSMDLATAAEARLMEALGLDDLDLTPQKCYSRRFRDLEIEARFDAEHFNPKYDRLLRRLNKCGDARLGDLLLQPIRRGVAPEYVEGGDVVVINSQHVRREELRLDDNRTTRSALITGTGRNAKLSVGDVLLNSTGYITIGRSQAIIESLEAVVDSHVAILKSKLDPVFLSVFLNSQAGYLQTERNWTGSSGQIELRSEAVTNYRIWNPPMKEQLAIRKLYESGVKARREAAELLEKAKKIVEDLITGGKAK